MTWGYNEREIFHPLTVALAKRIPRGGENYMKNHEIKLVDSKENFRIPHNLTIVVQVPCWDVVVDK